MLVAPALVLAFSSAAAGVAVSEAQEMSVVHAVLFWDRACGNCEVVVNDVVPPLQERCGSRLQVHQLEISELTAYGILLGQLSTTEYRTSGKAWR